MSARAGTGIVVAKLPNGEWSPPAAIGVGGLGGGFNAGAEMVDFLIVLNSRAAVRSFMTSGSIQLGGNLSLAVGPLGRTGEAGASLSSEMKLSAMFSYSVSRGLYGGITVEGTVLMERAEANERAYGGPVKAVDILAGRVDMPPFAEPLLNRIAEVAGTEELGDEASSLAASDNTSDFDTPAYAPAPRRRAPQPRALARTSTQLGLDPMDDLDAQLQSSRLDAPDTQTSRVRAEPRTSASWRSSTKGKPADRPAAVSQRRLDSVGKGSFASRQLWGVSDGDDPFADQPDKAHTPPHTAFSSDHEDDSVAAPPPVRRAAPRPGASAQAPEPRGAAPATASLLDDVEPAPLTESRAAPAKRSEPRLDLIDPSLLEGDLVIALHNFEAQQPTDLSFHQGDLIRVTRRTDRASDWWSGELVAHFGSGPPPSGEYVRSTDAGSRPTTPNLFR